MEHFYSRPCGRGDPIDYNDFFRDKTFLLTPLREGRPMRTGFPNGAAYFYSRPCGRGDTGPFGTEAVSVHFYSRPCGRGDYLQSI